MNHFLLSNLQFNPLWGIQTHMTFMIQLFLVHDTLLFRFMESSLQKAFGKYYEMFHSNKMKHPLCAIIKSNFVLYMSLYWAQDENKQ